jgi:hypothetical protein
MPSVPFFLKSACIVAADFAIVVFVESLYSAQQMLQTWQVAFLHPYILTTT